MIEIGKMNELTVIRENNSGYYLKGEFSEEEIFMPPSLGPKDRKVKINDQLEAFIYLDSTDSLLATTTRPFAVVGEYAFMDVLNVETFGAFFKWGISKDLLVPDTEQKTPVREHSAHIVRVCLDDRTHRVYGTTKLGKYIQASEFDIEEGQEVILLPSTKEELGYRCIINKKFIGMIYHSEIFQDIKIGKTIKGVVKKIREDGLVDAALQTQGFQNLLSSKEKVLQFIEGLGGSTTLHDKSSPEEIKNALGMSKQTFKKTIGMLYRDRLINISKAGIELTKHTRSDD